jgi:putative aminopeptidase FrvX
MDLEAHLAALSEAPGISGYEGPVREVVRAAWEGLVDDLEADRLGSLIGTRYGSGEEPRPRLLIAAHMDEIGLMVTRIEGAFLRVTRVGGVDRRVLLGQPVIVHGEEAIPGLVGSRPPHVLSADERNKYPEFDDLVIDTGLSARRLKDRVRIGAPVSFARRAVRLENGLLSGKALDNRASVAALTLLLHELQPISHLWDVLAAATVQEEVSMAGAETLAWRTRPDLAVVVDTTFGVGTGVTADRGFKLGGGPSIIVGPNAHPKLFDRLRETARRLEVDLHPEPAPRSSGTDGWVVQVSREGVPTAILGIPIRNMHTPVEVVALKDIKRVARLLAGFIGELDGRTLDQLALDAGEWKAAHG